MVFNGDRTVNQTYERVAVECAIQGTGNTLTIDVKDPMQPCLGVETRTGLSFGRFAISRCPCKKLILDDIHIKCISAVPHFSIGAYGYDDMPEIELRNGATLEAPDYGTPGYVRRMVSKPPMTPGSTKLNGEVKYNYDTLEDVYKVNPLLYRFAEAFGGDIPANCNELVGNLLKDSQIEELIATGKLHETQPDITYSVNDCYAIMALVELGKPLSLKTKSFADNIIGDAEVCAMLMGRGGSPVDYVHENYTWRDYSKYPHFFRCMQLANGDTVEYFWGDEIKKLIPPAILNTGKPLSEIVKEFKL